MGLKSSNLNSVHPNIENKKHTYAKIIFTTDQESVTSRCRKTPPEQRINGMNKIKQPPIPLPCRLCGVTSHSVIVQHGEGIGGFFITPMTDQERKAATAARKKAWRAANREKEKARRAELHAANPEKQKAADAAYRAANPEKRKATKDKWRAANPDKVREQNCKWRAANPDKDKSYSLKWRKSNPEKSKTASARWKTYKLSTDPVFVMRNRLKARVNTALKMSGFKKQSRTEKMLGCSFKQFAKHIESQFTDGMSWDNRSEWHLDHILPLSCATTIEGMERLSHYTNIRPLWAAQNLVKSDNLVLIP